MVGYPDKFNGYFVHDSKNWHKFSYEEFEPKKFEDTDIDIEIQYCGICGSDIHTITAGWGEADFPVCVGHEAVGKVLKVGSKVKGVKVGDIAGVGAQVWSCGECAQCKNDNENYCPKQVDTYNAQYDHLGGTKTRGGYATHIRATEQFVFPIPSGLDPALAAPMLCAGLTVYSPLVRNGCGKGKKVLIAGLGGLGHFAVLFAAALGAEVSVATRNPDKEKDAKALGAKHFIEAGKKGWQDDFAMHFDLIVSTIDTPFGFNDYLPTLSVNGHLIQVGLPDGAFAELPATAFMSNGALVGGSHIGSKKEVLEMLDLAAKQNIKSWIEKVPISSSNLSDAVQRLKKNDVRYRFVLTDFDKIGN